MPGVCIVARDCERRTILKSRSSPKTLAISSSPACSTCFSVRASVLETTRRRAIFENVASAFQLGVLLAQARVLCGELLVARDRAADHFRTIGHAIAATPALARAGVPGLRQVLGPLRERRHFREGESQIRHHRSDLPYCLMPCLIGSCSITIR